MGIIPQGDGIPCYVSDILYLHMSQRYLHSLTLAKLLSLLVANPDEVVQRARPEIWSVQRLDTRVTVL